MRPVLLHRAAMSKDARAARPARIPLRWLFAILRLLRSVARASAVAQRLCCPSFAALPGVATRDAAFSVPLVISLRAMPWRALRALALVSRFAATRPAVLRRAAVSKDVGAAHPVHKPLFAILHR